MNWLDIVISVPLLLGAYSGFKKGLIAQVVGIIGLCIGIWAGTQHPEWTYFLIKDRVMDEYLSIVAFIILFLVVVFTAALITKAIEKIVNFVQLKMVNKIGGVLLGITKVLAFLMVAVFILEQWDKENFLIPQETKQSSVLFPILHETSVVLLPEIQNQQIVEIPSLQNIE